MAAMRGRDVSGRKAAESFAGCRHGTDTGHSVARRGVGIDAAPARMQQRPAIPGRNTKTGIRSDATEEGVNMDTHPGGNTHR